MLGTLRTDLKQLRPLEMQRAGGLPLMLFLALGGAYLTALFAAIRFHVGFTPVPITGQVFAVLLCGALLGGRYGALSQVFYIALAAFGVPWLATAAGLAALTGVTSGYLYGFILAAAFLGIATRRFAWARTFHGQAYLMFAAVGVIYLCGATGLMFALKCGPGQALAAGVVPFAPFDFVKVLLAATITSRLLRG